MAHKRSLLQARKDIVSWFTKSSIRVCRPNDIFEVFRLNRDQWGLKKTTGAKEFLGFLLANTELQQHKFAFPKNEITLYSWGKDIPTYEIVQALGSGGYISHYSAAFINELTEQIPKTIYLTNPQPLKRQGPVQLSQQQIDAAFSKPFRETKNIAKMADYRVALLTGMDSDKLGLIEAIAPDGAKVRVTSIERTLIDMVVRPTYSGGIHQVLDAFGLASGRVSFNKLVAIYKKIGFVYPYHQAIGFYAEKSGVYSEKQLKFLKDLEQTRDFYLMHGIKENKYSKNWRLFFPQRF